jgi:WD40 repeat protein
LDLPQPVWVHDLQFMDESGTQVAVATHYHQVECWIYSGRTISYTVYFFSSPQIRLYDFSKGRRPVLTVEIGKVPLTTLSVGMDYDHVIFTDTRNDVGLFNVRNGKVVAQLKGK